jgi:hypothetical protein
MQFGATNLLAFPITMAVQAHSVGHLALLFDFFLMTGIFAAHFVGNKLSVVNRDPSTLDDLIWDLMTIPAACLSRFVAIFSALKKMARKTHINIDIEVHISFKMTMT